MSTELPLITQRWKCDVKRLQPGGIIGHGITVYGVHGPGAEYVRGLQIGNVFVERRTELGTESHLPESVDELRERVVRQVAPPLPPDALRDRLGRAVGYLVYRDLPDDFCKATAERDGPR